jgi:hypothetical protein
MINDRGPASFRIFDVYPLAHPSLRDLLAHLIQFNLESTSIREHIYHQPLSSRNGRPDPDHLLS